MRARPRFVRPPERRLLVAALLAAPIPLLSHSVAAERAAEAPSFEALRLASVPLPGTHDERAVHEGLALEVFLSPSDFPDALVRLTLGDDAAQFAVDLDASARRGRAVPARVRWPRLAGRPLTVLPPSESLPLTPLPGAAPPSEDDLDAQDLTLEWYLRPEEGEEGRELVGTVRAVRLASPDGGTLLAWLAPPEASGCGDAPPGQPRCRVRGLPRVVRSVAVHPSGRWLAVAGGDLRPRVDVVGTRPMVPLRRIAFPPWLGTPLGAEFTPDGRLVVVADGAGTVHVWDAASGGGHRVVASRVRSFVLLDAGRLLAASDAGGGLSIWRLRDGTVVAGVARGTLAPAPLIAASGDGLRVAALAYSEGSATAVVWDVEARQMAARLERLGAGFVALALDADGEHLLATHDRRGLLRGRVGPAGMLAPWGGEAGLRCRGRLAWSPGRTLLACAAEGGVELLRAGDGSLVASLSAGALAEPLSALAFAPDGSAVVGTAGGSLLEWAAPPEPAGGGR